MVAVRVNGGKELLAKLASRCDRIATASAAALYQKALQIMADADRLVPVKTGRLRASHYVALPEIISGFIRVRLGYGTKYALPVHERLEAHHEHGQAKYLETPFNEHKSGLTEWFARKISENLERNVGVPSASFPTAGSER